MSYKEMLILFGVSLGTIMVVNMTPLRGMVKQ